MTDLICIQCSGKYVTNEGKVLVKNNTTTQHTTPTQESVAFFYEHHMFVKAGNIHSKTTQAYIFFVLLRTSHVRDAG
jgi:hypothetical protein